MGKFKGTQGTSGATSWEPVVGVTAENYYQRARDCFQARGTAFLVALENGKAGDVEYSYSAKQWGAWLAFFKARKIPHALMLQRTWYQVPTEWPHEFCVEATIQGDYEVGTAFERQFLKQRAEEKAALARRADRAATAAAAKAKIRSDPRKQPTPAEHLDVAPEIDPPWKTDMRPAAHLLETDLLAE